MKTVECASWSEFREFVENEESQSSAYWRGQAEPSWPLASGFERLILALNGGTRPTAAMVYP